MLEVIEVTERTTLRFDHELGRVDLRIITDRLDVSSNDGPREEIPGATRAEGTLVLRPGKIVERGEAVRIDLPTFRGLLLCCGAPINGVAELVSWGKFDLPDRDNIIQDRGTGLEGSQ